MLSAEQVKPLLLHEDSTVRDLAAEYFRDSWSRDAELVPLILRACRQYGFEENVHSLVGCNHFPISSEALHELLGILAETTDARTILRLQSILIKAPGDLMLRHASALRDAPNNYVDLIPRIERRMDLSSWLGGSLWEELVRIDEESDGKQYVGEIDHAYVDDLIDALARHEEPSEESICDLLKTLADEGKWLETFLVDLVGERRLPQAIPLLVDCIATDGEFLLERVLRAVPKIGDPEAVRLIRPIFPDASWHYKNYASGIIGSIKHPDSEQAILELLKTEDDPGIRAMLCMELCDMFSELGVEVVRRTIHDGYDRMFVCLEEHLLPASKVLGIELPEADQWRAEREERERFREERQAELAELGRKYEALKARGIDPFNPKPRPRQNHMPLADTTALQQLERPRVGRNEACPCGSGKKFKKCCGRRS